MSTIEERYQEKLRARREGRTPVVVQQPAPSSIEGDSPEAVEARYRAKVAARAAKPAEGKPEGKPETTAKPEGKNGNGKKGDEGKGEAAKPAEGKPEGKPETTAK